MLRKRVVLSDGSEVLLRLGESQDFEMVWRMLSTLSEESLRFLPNPFIREEVEEMMANVDYEKLLPVVAVVEGKPSIQTRVVAIATLGFQVGVSRRHRAEFDIVVHDDLQGRGLGTILTQLMIEVARERGLKKVYLKTSTQNVRALHVYEKVGYKIEGQLVMEYYHPILGEYGDQYRMAILL